MSDYEARLHHRKDLRVALRVPMRFRVEDQGPEFEAWTRDLSSGGMLFSCPKAPGTGRQLEVRFRIREGEKEQKMRGLVRRLRGDPESLDSPRYLVAVNFIKMSDPARAALRRRVMDLVCELVEHMQEFPAFAKLSEFDLVTLASVCHSLSLGAGETLLRQGDEARSLFVVTKGRVKLLGRRVDQDSETVEIAGQGQIFGEVSTLTGLPHDLDIEALQDAELLALPREGLEYLKRSLPDTALRLMDVFMRFAGMRLRRMTRRAFSPVSLD
jgi:CRP-like cAMP-binding protein